MDKSNVIAVAAVLGIAGFLVGRWDAKPATAAPASAMAVAASPGAAPTPEAAPAAEPARPAEAAAAAPSTPEPAAPSAPAAPSLLDSQSDEGAGKGVDIAKVGVSPKNGDSPYIGVKDPLVVVNVFSDFQCPVCKRSADPIKQLAADFPGKVQVYFRNNALEMHGRSKPAALACTAAGKQGKFWQYHDKLFQEQALDDGSLKKYAQELGLDMAQWEKDIADPKLAERIKEESSWAEKMGASGTPAFFVNGVRQVGWGSYLALKSIVAREVEKGDELIASGTPKAKVVAARIQALADKNNKNEGEGAIDGANWATLLTRD